MREREFLDIFYLLVIWLLALRGIGHRCDLPLSSLDFRDDTLAAAAE
jgi:hypothetical protein